MTTLSEAAASGQLSFEHIPYFSFDPPQDENFEAAVLELAAAMKQNGTFLAPTLVAMRGRLQTVDQLRIEHAAAEPRRRYISKRALEEWADQLEERSKEGESLDCRSSAPGRCSKDPVRAGRGNRPGNSQPGCKTPVRPDHDRHVPCQWRPSAGAGISNSDAS